MLSKSTEELKKPVIMLMRFCVKLIRANSFLLLQIFSSERKFYDRKKLAVHRRVGDTDDTSHRGHPLCEFCDERYLDNDELVKHLRKDHYYCHFCETDGISNQFFGYV